MFKQKLLLLGKSPICNTVIKASRRSSVVKMNYDPVYDPYIPRKDAFFYNCSSVECEPITLQSITQLTSPKLKLRACFVQADKYECEPIRYNYLKLIDKLLFLSDNIPNQTFYVVDCLIYADRGRVCQKKDGDFESHIKLVNAGSLLRSNESNVLSQDEFICEESEDKQVNCDLNAFVPASDELVTKDTVKIIGDVVLKKENDLVVLKHNCLESWCGYSGKFTLDAPPSVKTRRLNNYQSPGGKTYRCYYANRQQVCKQYTEDIGLRNLENALVFN